MNYIVIVDGKAGAYGVVIPDLPGCTAMGPTVDQALANAADAARDWMDVTEARGGTGAPPPPPPPAAEIIAFEPEYAEAVDGTGAFLAWLPVVRGARRKVRANMSIDAGVLAAIDATAERVGEDRSRVVELLATPSNLLALA